MVRRQTFHRSLFAAAAFALLAAGSLSAAEPRLIKIKGTDNMQYDVKKIEAKPGEALKVQLTTVKQPITRFGIKAVELLIDLIENDIKPARRVILDTEIIVRDSCGAHKIREQA